MPPGSAKFGLSGRHCRQQTPATQAGYRFVPAWALRRRVGRLWFAPAWAGTVGFFGWEEVARVDAVRRMASDHEALDDLVRRLGASATTDGRAELADEFVRRLRAHVKAADELVVPLLKERATSRDLEQLQKVVAVDARLAEELERLA